MRAARVEKAKAVFPRPSAGLLRPVVRGQTLKYNAKQRLGKGFTLDELKVGGDAAWRRRWRGTWPASAAAARQLGCGAAACLLPGMRVSAAARRQGGQPSRQLAVCFF